MVQSKISSSTKEDKKNQDTIKTYFEPLPIVTSETSKAIRAGFYSRYSNKFIFGYPYVAKYFVPKQNLSSIYAGQSGSYKNNTKIVGQNYDFVLPENYQDIFNSKSTILNTYQNIDFSVSLNTNVFSTECFDPQCEGIFATFVQPSFDTNINLYSDSNNFGISFNNKDLFNAPLQNISSPIIVDLKMNNETIVSIVYNQEFILTEVAVKHPLIPTNFTIILPSSDREIHI
jgi:hypothetical protein